MTNGTSTDCQKGTITTQMVFTLTRKDSMNSVDTMIRMDTTFREKRTSMSLPKMMMKKTSSSDSMRMEQMMRTPTMTFRSKSTKIT